jgi:hypothetical protein
MNDVDIARLKDYVKDNMVNNLYKLKVICDSELYFTGIRCGSNGVPEKVNMNESGHSVHLFFPTSLGDNLKTIPHLYLPSDFKNQIRHRIVTHYIGRHTHLNQLDSIEYKVKIYNLQCVLIENNFIDDDDSVSVKV